MLIAQTPPSPALLRYLGKRVAASIQIDGKLDEPAWATAGKFELGFLWLSQAGPQQKTAVRLLWDDTYLYVAFDCVDTDITATRTNRDDPVDRDDSPSSSSTRGPLKPMATSAWR